MTTDMNDDRARKILVRYAEQAIANRTMSFIGMKTFLMQIVHQMRSSLHDVDAVTSLAITLAEEYGTKKEVA